MNVFRYFRFATITTNGRTYEMLTSNLNELRSPNIKRSFMGQTYEGTGKTTGHIINKKGVSCICIDRISEKGFTLTNGWKVMGPTIFFPHTMLSWNIKDLSDISVESLSLYSVLHPMIDVLLLGVGRKEDLSYEKMKDIINVCRGMKINFEIMSTADAAATFNFCSVDRRFISAALIPPISISYNHGLRLIEASALPDVQH